MEDLSHWDFAEHFKAKEAAELIAGIPPEKNTNLFGVMGEEAQFVSRITPILRRMEWAYESAGNLLNAAATWGEEPDKALSLFPANPGFLESEPMTRVRSTESSYGLSRFSENIPPFGQAYFTREELARWLSAIKLPSVYRFRSTEPDFFDSTGVTSNRPYSLETAFDRTGGNDREELHQWLMMDTWPMQAAMALIEGVIPAHVYDGFGYFKIEGGLLHNDDGDRDSRAARIEDLERLWKSNPQHPDSAPPKYFFDWAKSKQIEIYWLESAKRAGYFPDAVTKPEELDKIHPKVQKTLLTIIAILCKEANLDYTKPAKTAAVIQNAAERLGISIGETTIEGHLKKIPDALESRMK